MASVAILTGLAVVQSEASSISIEVVCDNGNRIVGHIDVTTRGRHIDGGFTADIPGKDLTAAAAICGEDHFNWYQIVVDDTGVSPINAAGQRLNPPYVDPPPGGTIDDPQSPNFDETQLADKFPWFWDEGADLHQGTNLLDHILDDNTRLEFTDDPDNIHNSRSTFRTWLVSLNVDGSFHSWHPGFTWTWEKDDIGFITISDLREINEPQRSDYEDLIGDFQEVPEPSTLSLVALGVAALARRWSRPPAREHCSPRGVLPSP